MKNPNRTINTILAFIAAILLFIAGCYHFEYVNQPDVADLNSSFTVEICVQTEDPLQPGYYYPYFGIKLPDGWSVEDSIAFTYGDSTGTFVYSDSLVNLMNQIDPPETGYYWWVSTGIEQVLYQESGVNYLFNPLIIAGPISGIYYLDYMTGSNSQLNYRRSNDHFIHCGVMADTVYVTSSAPSGPGTLAAAFNEVATGGTILFDLELPATIYPDVAYNITRDVNIIGPESNNLTISGSGIIRIFDITAQTTNLEHLVIAEGNALENGGAIWYSSYSSSQEHRLSDIVFIGNQGWNGGAIFFNQGAIELENVHFFNNSAIDYGGAIYNNNGFLDLENVTFNGNNAYYGGGLFSSGSLNFDNVILTGNAAAYGGAINFGNHPDGLMQDCEISENWASNSGGGLYFSGSGAGDLQMKKVRVIHNEAGNQGGGIFGNSHISFNQYMRCDIFSNLAPAGPDLYGSNASTVYLDRFTVIQPNDYFAYETGEGYEFDIQQGIYPMIDQDVYVSPVGSDDNAGTSPEQPLKTIAHALKWTFGNAVDPNTIHLAPGTYSPAATGEMLPLYPHEYLSIVGAGTDSCIIDTESSGQPVFMLVNDHDFSVSNIAFQTSAQAPCFDMSNSSLNLGDFSITGNDEGFYKALDCRNASNPVLSEGEITHCQYGIFAESGSTVDLDNVRFAENEWACHLEGNATAFLDGCLIENNQGALAVTGYSHIELSGTTIRNNTCTQPGGGIMFSASTAWFDPDDRCNIYTNHACLGNDLYAENLPDNILVCVDTFSVLYPGNYHAYPFNQFDFDILHGKIPQVDQDLYVSPDGSDENSGLTQDDPLQSLTRAVQMMAPGSGPTQTIHLAAGIYSPDSTGEYFPVFVDQNTSLAGSVYDTAIIDGGYTTQIMHIRDADAISLENLVIRNAGGSTYFEGAVYCGGSTLNISNVTLEMNLAGGLLIENSTVTVDNAIVRNNHSFGITFRDSCDFTSNSLEISGNYSNGIFTDNAVVTLQDILLSDNRRGINVSGGTVACINITAVGNSLTSLSNYWYGGGIYASGADLEIQNCTFSDNGAYNGGGGYFTNTQAQIVNSNWNNNQTGTGYGGGIYISGGQITLLNDTIEENRSGNYGGGLYLENSLVDIKGCVIKKNTSGNCGGGLYVYGSPELVISDCQITFNDANNDGGGMYLRNTAPWISNTDIYANSSNFGGGVYFGSGSSASWDDIERCDIFLNKSDSRGFDLYSANGSYIIPVVVDTFTVMEPTDIHASPPENFEFDILNATMEMGEYDIYVNPLGSDLNAGTSPESPLRSIWMATIRMTGDTVLPYVIHLSEGSYSASLTDEILPIELANDVILSGAGEELTILDGENESQLVHLSDKQNIVLKNLRLTHGYEYDKGGAMSCENTSGLTLENLTIDSSHANYGGGLYSSNTEMSMFEVTIKDNDTKYNGGGWCAELNNTAVLEKVNITGNFAGWNGGGFSNGSGQGHTDIQGKDVRIEHNRTASRGGGIYLTRGTFRLDNLILAKNMSTSGGGIAISSSEGILQNFLIAGDTATTFGGGLYSRYSEIDMVNITISGNQCIGNPETGGSYLELENMIAMRNCISWGNYSNEIKINRSTLTVDHCNIAGGKEGIINDQGTLNWLEGNLDEDPVFLMDGDHPYQLAFGSPCIDAGAPDTTGLNLPLWDLLSNYRLMDGDNDGDTIVDMGAYEYKYSPVYSPELRIKNSELRIGVYPNPSLGVYNLQFTVYCLQWVTAKIYSVDGTEIETLFEGKFNVGEHLVRFDISDLPAGLYFLKVQAGDEIVIIKVVKQ